MTVKGLRVKQPPNYIKNWLLFQKYVDESYSFFHSSNYCILSKKILAQNFMRLYCSINCLDFFICYSLVKSNLHMNFI